MRDLLDRLNSPLLTAFGVPTSWAEVLGFVSGAVCVYLVTRQSAWSWPVGIVNNLMWLVLFGVAGLFADSGLQVVYVVLAVYGWSRWLRGGVAGSSLVVTFTGSREWWGLAVGGVVGFGVLYLVLESLTSSTVPAADALTTTASLLATWGQCRKKVESWWFWIAADVVYVPLYLHKGLVLTALLYVVFLGLCVKGLLDWRADLTSRSAGGRDRVLA